MTMKKPANKVGTERLTIRVPLELKEKYNRAAELRRETFSQWAKRVLDEAAERQLREQEFAALALSERVDFMKIVLNPPAV